MSVEKETEEKILEAARNVFQRRGFDGARMQEIADVAEINKSMLHYYYRSKENLFFEVFKSAVGKILPYVFEILGSESSLGEKVSDIVEFYHRTFQENPQLPSFVIFEMNQNPERFKTFIGSMEMQLPVAFTDQLRNEIEAGRIKPIKPQHFLINIISVCMMPMIGRTMVQTLFRMDDSEYFGFIDERKELLTEFLFKGFQMTKEGTV